jgi:ATP-binding cassette, subfamily B, bacterial
VPHSLPKADRIEGKIVKISLEEQDGAGSWEYPGVIPFDAFRRGFILHSRVWQRLVRQIKMPEHQWAVWIFGALAGILIPILLVLGGWLIQLLLAGHLSLIDGKNVSRLPEQLTVGRFFTLNSSWLNAGGSILRGVFGIVVLLVIVIALECITLLTSYRAALYTSLEITVDLQRKLFVKSGALAMEQGLSGQQDAMQEMLFVHVPTIRESMSLWFRVLPRHIIQASLLLLLAASVHLWITLLALICTVFVWVLFSGLDSTRRKKRPVLFERARAASEQLSYLCNTAPLLAFVHDQEDTKLSYEAHLNSYRAAQLQLADGGTWKSPIMLSTSAALIAFLMIVVSIRFLDESSSLHFGEILVMCSSITLAVASVQRFNRAFRRYKTAEPAAERLSSYLEQVTPDVSRENRIVPTKISQNIVLEHVTIKNSSGQKLLEDISATIRPGQLTAVVASQSVQASAFAELIFGFGRPSSGRILVDGVDTTDLDPSAVRNLSLWATARGPLVHGTVEDNLWSVASPDATVDLMSIAKRMHVSDAILNLPDGLSTLVTPDEDRLLPDALFRIGLARALVKKRSLIVAQEPSVRVKPTTESETLNSILQLKSESTLLVVLTQRLSTLRSADQIIVIHEHKVASIGKHAQLLEQSEIYRHLNYMQFSPFLENKQ